MHVAECTKSGMYQVRPLTFLEAGWLKLSPGLRRREAGVRRSLTHYLSDPQVKIHVGWLSGSWLQVHDQISRLDEMGLLAPSLKDMDAWEVSGRRKPAKLANGNRRSVNVIMWSVDGSAILAHPQRGRTECCTSALWRRMMCAQSVGRIKGGQGQSKVADDQHSDSDLDFGTHNDLLDLGQPQKPRMSFGLRRWPQGWV